MTGSVFLLATAAAAVFGAPVAALAPAGRSAVGGRLALAIGGGTVILAAELFATSWLGIGWTLPLFVALALTSVLLSRAIGASRTPIVVPGASKSPVLALVLTLVALALAAYAAGTARATAADLIHFWGPKGQAFGIARGIDLSFLSDPRNYLLHPDYPPIVPLLYGWATMLAGRFAWGASLLTMPFFLGAAVLALWSWSRRSWGSRRGAELTCVFAALEGYCLIVSGTAGNGEPPLIFFESLCLTVVLFGGENDASLAAAGIALGGAAWTKFEGGAFVAIFVITYLVFGRPRIGRMRAAFLLSLPTGALLGAWIAFCHHAGILDVYRGGQGGPFNPRSFPRVLRVLASQGSYDAFFLPWLVIALFFLALPGGRRRRMVFGMGLADLALVIFFYMHGTADSSIWILWSGQRTLLTPLTCFFFSAIAPASSDDEAQDGRSGLPHEPARLTAGEAEAGGRRGVSGRGTLVAAGGIEPPTWRL